MTAMLALGCLRTPILSAEILDVIGLVTSVYGRHDKVPGMLASQRDGVTEHAKLQRITTDCGTGQFDLGTLDKSQDHKALHHGIATVNAVDNVLLTAFQ
jgi:hypothetical protein